MFGMIFAYFPLGLPSNMAPIGPVWAGPIDNPGIKERVEEVASNEKGLERVSQGLPGTSSGSMGMSNDPGVPKPVKKTFAKNITQDELQDRLRGAAVKGTNVPGSSSKGDIKTAGTQSSSPEIGLAMHFYRAHTFSMPLGNASVLLLNLRLFPMTYCRFDF